MAGLLFCHGSSPVPGTTYISDVFEYTPKMSEIKGLAPRCLRVFAAENGCLYTGGPKSAPVEAPWHPSRHMTADIAPRSRSARRATPAPSAPSARLTLG